MKWPELIIQSLSALTVDDIPALSAIDGPFQLAEYLALKIRADPHDVAGLVEVPAEGRSTDRDVVSAAIYMKWKMNTLTMPVDI